MESDHSLRVLILIFFLFSRKLVVCASFKCHQVSVTHFLSLMYCKTFWHYSVVFCTVFFRYSFGLVTHLYLWASSLSVEGLSVGESFIRLWHFPFASLAVRGLVSNTQPFRSAALTSPGLSKQCFSVVLGFLLGFLPFQLYLLFF